MISSKHKTIKDSDFQKEKTKVVKEKIKVQVPAIGEQGAQTKIFD